VIRSDIQGEEQSMSREVGPVKASVLLTMLPCSPSPLADPTCGDNGDKGWVSVAHSTFSDFLPRFWLLLESKNSSELEKHQEFYRLSRQAW
jgi:hypothetical protein